KSEGAPADVEAGPLHALRRKPFKPLLVGRLKQPDAARHEGAQIVLRPAARRRQHHVSHHDDRAAALNQYLGSLVEARCDDNEALHTEHAAAEETDSAAEIRVNSLRALIEIDEARVACEGKTDRRRQVPFRGSRAGPCKKTQTAEPKQSPHNLQRRRLFYEAQEQCGKQRSRDVAVVEVERRTESVAVREKDEGQMTVGHLQEQR